MSSNSSTDQDFPVPDGWELAEEDERPGEPLHPGKNTIVDRGNNPLQQGEIIAVWADHYADGHGTATCRANLQVVGDNGEGDILAILADEEPLEASRVFRIKADLSNLVAGFVYSVPEYNEEEGVLTVTREIKSHGSRNLTVLEARSLGGQQDWAMMPDSDL